MNNYTVYMHITPVNKYYIGLTKLEPELRFDNGMGYIKNKIFYKDILKYGWDNIKHYILYTGLAKEEAEQAEKELIELCHSTNPIFGYNILRGINIKNLSKKRLIYGRTKLQDDIIKLWQGGMKPADIAKKTEMFI